MKTEIEGPGINYERYALGKCLERIARKYNVKTVLEIPAWGSKVMPSLYSLGFGQAGCSVTLANADKKAITAWRELGFKAKFADVADICKTQFEDNSFDFVWDFTFLPKAEDKNKKLAEMVRISKKYVAVFCVNGYNPGFMSHRLAHKFHKIPWTHGEPGLHFLKNLRAMFLRNNLKITEVGVVNTPPWPDSIGFRDIKIHKMNFSGEINWHSETLNYIKNSNTPDWIKKIHKFESLPIPLAIKLIYAHIYYVIGEKL